MTLISISQRIGSGGLDIARLLADRLQLQLYDDTKLHEEALDIGIPKEDIQGLNEKAPGFFDRLLTNKPEIYLNIMESVIYEVSKKNACVIIGHGSQMLLRDFGCALHVFIHSSVPARVQRLMDKEGLSNEAAEKVIQKRDNQQNGFFRFAFQKDLNNPSLYDLIINTEKISLETSVSLISDVAVDPEIQSCSLHALESMGKLAQERQVRALLLKNDVDVTSIHIEVPEIGEIYLRGLIGTQDEKNKILKLVKQASGIKDIRSEISVIPTGY